MANILPGADKTLDLSGAKPGDVVDLGAAGRYTRTTTGFEAQGGVPPLNIAPTIQNPGGGTGAYAQPSVTPPGTNTTSYTPENRFPTNVTPEQAADDARAAALKNAQDQINSINTGYDAELQRELAAQAPINANAEGRVRSLSALMGLAGSSSADTRANVAEQASAKQNQLITEGVTAKKMAALSAIYGNIDTISNNAYKAQKETNEKNRQAQLDANAKSADATVQALAGQLAQSGRNFDDFKTNSPQELQTLLDATGKTEYQLRQDWQKALPPEYQAKTTDWSISKDAQGNAVMTRSTYDPITKTNKPESYSTGQPYESVATGKLTEMKNGDQVLMYPNGTYKMVKAYTPTELERSTIAKNYAEAQKAKETTNAQLSKTQYSRLSEAGVSQGLADQITSDILSGASLEDIRAAMRKNNVDTTTLDTYDRVVGIASLIKTAKPKSSGGFQ